MLVVQTNITKWGVKGGLPNQNSEMEDKEKINNGRRHTNKKNGRQADVF